MALAYDTYYATPRLDTYADAKAHYDKVEPIARDPHNVRPLGKRKQPWITIWQDPNTKAIVAGYGRGELSKRRPLVSWERGGVINIHRNTRFTSAACNERIQRLLGTDVQTHQYGQWIRCAWYDSGVRNMGYLPVLPNVTARDWRSPDQTASFVREASGNLVFLDYTYPVTHTLNKSSLKTHLEPYKGFLGYSRSMAKVFDGKDIIISRETCMELFGSTFSSWTKRDEPNHSGLNLNYGEEKERDRAIFDEWLRGDDPDNWIRAMVVLDEAYIAKGQPMRERLTAWLLNTRPRDLLETTVHKDGKLVRDRYRRYLLNVG